MSPPTSPGMPAPSSLGWIRRRLAAAAGSSPTPTPGRWWKRKKKPRPAPEEEEHLDLSHAVQDLFAEVQKMLPGLLAMAVVQAVLLVFVFSLQLSATGQLLQLIAVGLMGVAIAIIVSPLVAMAIAPILPPAPYPPRRRIGKLTGTFHRLSNRMLVAGKSILALSVAVEFFVAAELLGGPPWISWIAVVLLVAML